MCATTNCTKNFQAHCPNHSAHIRVEGPLYVAKVHRFLKLVHLNGDHVKLNLLAMKYSSGQKHLRRKNEMPLLAPVHAQFRRVRSCAAGFDLDHNEQVGVRKCGQQVKFQVSQAQIARDDVVAF